jgi:hypothetical protein
LRRYFVRDDGFYDFEEWRRDPEDPGNWYRARYHVKAVYAKAEQARSDARLKVEWYGELTDN